MDPTLISSPPPLLLRVAVKSCLGVLVQGVAPLWRQSWNKRNPILPRPTALALRPFVVVPMHTCLAVTGETLATGLYLNIPFSLSMLNSLSLCSKYFFLFYFSFFFSPPKLYLECVCYDCFSTGLICPKIKGLKKAAWFRVMR